MPPCIDRTSDTPSARALARGALAVLIAAAAAAASAQPADPSRPAPPAAAPSAFPVEGFLCCNLHSDGKWLSDINYRGSGMTMVHVGTPVKVTGHGRWRLLVEIDGHARGIGNDYSRSITMDQFQQRWIVPTSPAQRIASFPPKVQAAIKAGKVMRGMTREQVLMALGYPISSYNADLEQPIWRYWLNRSAEFQVFWADNGTVDRVFGSPEVRAQVAEE